MSRSNRSLKFWRQIAKFLQKFLLAKVLNGYVAERPWSNSIRFKKAHNSRLSKILRLLLQDIARTA